MNNLVSLILLGFALYVCTIGTKELQAKTYADETNSKGSVLGTYATRAGSTIEVANSIAFAIAEQGYMVNLMHIDNVGSLAGYDAIIIGRRLQPTFNP